MSGLTQGQKLLIQWMKSIGLDTETTVGIMTFLDTPKKMRAMGDFLHEEYEKGNKRPTEQQVLRKLEEIVTAM